MRAVAGVLGATAGSLYRYLSSRDQLLDLMVDAVLSELKLNRPSAGNWLDDLAALAEGQLALYRRHPWLLEASLRSGGFGPNATLFRTSTPEAVAIATQQLAAGVAELRDQIVDAWRQSADITVGFPLVTVRDAESGAVRITPATFGAD